ncbi:MAG: hypothetical protein HY925_15230 [Elusimicrobia bacterium]|nr:hypothetical protein [Elusimicrobiota bacterium]
MTSSLLAGYPDVVRYGRSELKPARLVFGLLASAIVGSCALVTAWTGDDPALLFFQYILGAQSIVLLGYGTARTAGSIIAERQEGTWDLQRLTPLSPRQLAIGKLAGAPIYAIFLALTLLPWALACFLFSKPLEVSVFVRGYASLIAGMFMAFAIGLAISAYSAEAVGGSYSSTTGVLAGLFAIQSFMPIVAAAGAKDTVKFYGVPLGPAFLWAVSSASLGAWAFLSAKWRIGKELLEGPRFWRLPAFLVFVFLYQFGWVAHQAAFPIGTLLLAPALFVYMASVLNSEKADHWKRWLRGAEPDALWHRAPVWVNGVVGYGILAAVTSLAYMRPNDAEWRLYPALQTAYLARDLMFLQWCRLQGWKRPEVVGLICIAFAYVLPAVVIGSSGIWSLRYVYIPVPNPDHGFWLNVLPGLLQAGLMARVLYGRLRPALARP